MGWLMYGARGWVRPEEEAHSLLRPLEEKITSSNIDVGHRDRLIRPHAILQVDLAVLCSGDQACAPMHKPLTFSPDPSCADHVTPAASPLGVAASWLEPVRLFWKRPTRAPPTCATQGALQREPDRF